MTWLAVAVKAGADRVFCGHCQASWPGKQMTGRVVRHVHEAHGVSPIVLGVDVALGARYGPGPGTRTWKMRGGGHWSHRRATRAAP